MLDEFLTDEQYNEKPVEIETVDTKKIYEKPFIKIGQKAIDDAFHTENADKCCWCQFRFTDPSKCENC